MLLIGWDNINSFSRTTACDIRAWPSERGVCWVRSQLPFPHKKQKQKRFETQLSNKYNMPYLIMILCKCDFVLLTTGIPPPPLKIGKNMIFLHKVLIFHTKYPQIFRTSLCSAKFFQCPPITWNAGSTPGNPNPQSPARPSPPPPHFPETCRRPCRVARNVPVKSPTNVVFQSDSKSDMVDFFLNLFPPKATLFEESRLAIRFLRNVVIF